MCWSSESVFVENFSNAFLDCIQRLQLETTCRDCRESNRIKGDAASEVRNSLGDTLTAISKTLSVTRLLDVEQQKVFDRCFCDRSVPSWNEISSPTGRCRKCARHQMNAMSFKILFQRYLRLKSKFKRRIRWKQALNYDTGEVASTSSSEASENTRRIIIRIVFALTHLPYPMKILTSQATCFPLISGHSLLESLYLSLSLSEHRLTHGCSSISA